MIRALVLAGIGFLSLALLVPTGGSYFVVPTSFGDSRPLAPTSQPAAQRTWPVVISRGLLVPRGSPVVQAPASSPGPSVIPAIIASGAVVGLALGVGGPWRTRPGVPFASRLPIKARRAGEVRLGLFDSLAKAFANEEFKEDDQRVRASHILCKGDDDVERIAAVMAELSERAQKQPDQLAPIFAELARRESECSSASMGGDLGTFGPGKMVQEFDAVLFPADAATAPPPGAILGPVVTDFGCHVILVTKREQNRDQVEEKLARND